MSASLTLLDALAQVPDPRHRQGIRHPLPAILSLVVLAMLSGSTSYTAIAQFGRDHGHALAFLLGFRRGKTPTKSSLSDLFRRLDISALEAALSRWVASRLPDGELHVCLDGKTLRGSKDGEVPGHHLVAAYAPEAQLVLGQLRVDAKTNEHKAALELLGIIPIRGRIVTGDAMFCQRDIAKKIVEDGGDYVLFAKDNQPSLVIDIQAGLSFEDEKRRQAAVFFPLRRGSPASEFGGEPHGKGAWPTRKTHDPADVDPDERSRLEGVEAGFRVAARDDAERKTMCGNGVWDHEFEPGPGGCAASVGTDASALGDRKRPALST